MVKREILSTNKHYFNNIKSTIIPYGISLFSIIFIGYITITTLHYYYMKYVL